MPALPGADTVPVVSSALMYSELFNLSELPFRLTPDPQFLYLSKSHARAKAYMESTVWFTDGFVVITGEIGCGKTTLIETFLRELQDDVVVAQINQTQVSAIEFLQTLLVVIIDDADDIEGIPSAPQSAVEGVVGVREAHQISRPFVDENVFFGFVQIVIKYLLIELYLGLKI